MNHTNWKSNIKFLILTIFLISTILQADDFKNLQNNNYDQPKIYYLKGLGNTSNVEIPIEEKYNLKNHFASLKFSRQRSDLIINIVQRYIKTSEYYPEGHYGEGPIGFSNILIIGFHSYKDLNKKGFSYGLYFVTLSSHVSGTLIPLPCPYLGFKIFRSKYSYVELNILDVTDILPYSIGYKRLTKFGTYHLKGYYIHDKSFAGILKLNFHVYKTIFLMSQYTYSNPGHNRIYQLGIGLGK